MSRQASGLQAWALQRLTAIYLALYLAYFILYLLFAMPPGQKAWQSWLTGGVMSIASYLAILCLLLHAWIGIRDVVIDYVKPPFVKVGLLSLVLVYLAGCGIWAGKLLMLAGMVD